MIEGSLNSDRFSIITRQEGRLTRTERDSEMMSRSESGRKKKKRTENARKINSHLFPFLQLHLLSDSQVSLGDLTVC